MLVGHSYGGVVIGGVAEKVPERIRRLVYLMHTFHKITKVYLIWNLT
jgi:pimeloyl-ACP methyl ester carboxylesterase